MPSTRLVGAPATGVGDVDEPPLAGVEAVARGGPRLTEERVRGDAGVHPATAHALTVEEEGDGNAPPGPGCCCHVIAPRRGRSASRRRPARPAAPGGSRPR